MEYAINILTEALNRLDSAHLKFVIKGTVPRTHPVALDNRKKVFELESAIAAIKEKIEETKKKEEQEKLFKELSDLTPEQLEENINRITKKK